MHSPWFWARSGRDRSGRFCSCLNVSKVGLPWYDLDGWTVVVGKAQVVTPLIEWPDRMRLYMAFCVLILSKNLAVFFIHGVQPRRVRRKSISLTSVCSKWFTSPLLVNLVIFPTVRNGMRISSSPSATFRRYLWCFFNPRAATILALPFSHIREWSHSERYQQMLQLLALWNNLLNFSSTHWGDGC